MATKLQQTRWTGAMRIPIILALIVVVTLPKDVHALASDVGAHLRSATGAVASLFDPGERAIQVADTQTVTVVSTR